MADLNTLLQETISSLDISPSDFELARSRYRATRQWLLDGNYHTGSHPKVYLQGSFRLGTIIRPYYRDKDGSFDIDQVFEFTQPSENSPPSALKEEIGDRLKSHGTYLRLLDEEGKRCWTLEYASEENRPGFHIDILPSKRNAERRETDIKITHKENDNYSWLPSSPEGYYRWFKSKNHFSEEFIKSRRSSLFEENREIYQNEQEVPKRLLRSPLQRSIQLMKRHRDVYFSNRDHKPISIIITTIATHLYEQEDILSTTKRFFNYVNSRHEELVLNGRLSPDGILDYLDGQWQVLNPADADQSHWEHENFADRWNIDNKFAASFFDWARKLGQNISRFERSKQPNDLRLKTSAINDNESLATLLARQMSDEVREERFDTNKLLELIHMAIDGEIDWPTVENIANKFVENDCPQNHDVDLINFLQILKHKGSWLPVKHSGVVSQIISRNSDDPAFILCGNLLLGHANYQMLERYMKRRADGSVLGWPIMKFAPPEVLLPPHRQ